MILIESQPITFRTAFETDSDCNIINNKIYCQLYEQTDTLTVQWKNEPCGADEACFSIGDNIVTNGNFDDGTDWTLSNFTIGGGTANISNNSGTLTQTFASLTEGDCYVILFTISDTGYSGEVEVFLGGTSAGTASGDASYTFVATAGGADEDLEFVAPANSTLKIDQVSVYPLECVCADNNYISVIHGIGLTDQICHDNSDNTATNITGWASPTPGKYYRATVTIANSTQGYVRFNIDGINDSDNFYGNGTFTFYDTATVAIPSLYMSADFDGCITGFTFYELPNAEDWEVGLFDLNGLYVAPLNTFGGANTNIILNDEYVTLQWLISDGDANGNPITDGCYKICLVDPCTQGGYAVYELGNKLFDDHFESGTGWTLHTGIAIASSLLTYTNLGSDSTPTATASLDFCVSCPLNVNIYFGAIDALYLGGKIEVTIAGVTTIVTITQDIIDNLSYSYTFEGDCNDTAVIIEFFGFDVDNGEVISIDRLVISTDQECLFTNEGSDYCSNCISIRDTHDCTTLITAYCNESSLGFNFDTFKMYGRYRTLFINPVSKNRNENYKLSNGSYYKNFAERDKVFDLLFDYVDEISHDAINTMLICDVLKFQSAGIPNNDEYVWLDDDYKPEWDAAGTRNIAQSRIQIRRKSGHLTNSNCD